MRLRKLTRPGPVKNEGDMTLVCDGNSSVSTSLEHDPGTFSGRANLDLVETSIFDWRLDGASPFPVLLLCSREDAYFEVQQYIYLVYWL